MNPFDRPVRKYMTTLVRTIAAGAPLQEAEAELTDATISCLGVVDRSGTLVGVLSRTDLLRVGRLRARMGEDPRLLKLPRQLVRQQMIHPPIVVAPTDSLIQAAERMVEHHIHRVFVVADGQPVGVLSTRDLMRAVVDERFADPIARWMTKPVVAVEVTDSVGFATDRLTSANVRGLVVLEDAWPVGIYTQTEALLAQGLEPGTPVEQAMSCAMLCLPMSMPLFRAAGFALTTRSRRILAVEARELRGILSGLDMARLIAHHSDPS